MPRRALGRGSSFLCAVRVGDFAPRFLDCRLARSICAHAGHRVFRWNIDCRAHCAGRYDQLFALFVAAALEVRDAADSCPRKRIAGMCDNFVRFGGKTDAWRAKPDRAGEARQPAAPRILEGCYSMCGGSERYLLPSSAGAGGDAGGALRVNRRPCPEFPWHILFRSTSFADFP